jgi:hypothetical protein
LRDWRRSSACPLWLYAIAPNHPWHDGTILLLLGYGAVTLSFLGGARWGLALADTDAETATEFSLAVVPALVAWMSLALPGPFAFAVLAAAFAAHGAWDTLAVHHERAPAWYGRLRTTLTVIVVATMVLGIFATS